ncbi:hypothetical protein QFC19_004227 [Naganishia cerealis]|uniref:Uncharacterized protein n=1 Tax=Naganishia cerealis TaxID=610337 RepID=A0ACC2VZ22_9TREE|nr:hypothetical protein QFC19_004227 [Naganishia cerealis]
MERSRPLQYPSFDGGWQEDVSELAYMDSSFEEALFDGGEHHHLPTTSSFVAFTSPTSTTNERPPQRKTSLSPTSLPLVKSPLPVPFLGEPTIYPVPRRSAPLPPRHSRSRTRSSGRSLQSQKSKWRMMLLGPEEVGLWTLLEDEEDVEGLVPTAFGIETPTSPTRRPHSTQRTSPLGETEGHTLWGDAKREKGAGYDETVAQMTQSVDPKKWISTATFAFDAGEPVGLGLALRMGSDCSPRGSMPTPKRPQRPERQFDGLFYVPPLSALHHSRSTAAGSEVASLKSKRGREVLMDLDSPTSSEESWGTVLPKENMATECTSVSSRSPALIFAAEVRPAHPRASLTINTTATQASARPFSTFPDLELRSPFTLTPTVTPYRSSTALVDRPREEDGLDMVSPLEKNVFGGRKRVTSAPAVVHPPDWTSCSSSSSISRSSSTSSSLLSKNGLITPPMTSYGLPMQRDQKRRSEVGVDLWNAFQRFLEAAHEPMFDCSVKEGEDFHDQLGGAMPVLAPPRTPHRKVNSSQTDRQLGPPPTPLKKRHTSRPSQSTVPRSCELLQFAIASTASEEVERIPCSAPCFGPSATDLVFDFRVMDVGAGGRASTCRASLILPPGAEVGVDSARQEGKAGMGNTRKGKGKRLPRRSTLPLQWISDSDIKEARVVLDIRDT